MDIGLILSTNWLAILVGAISSFVLGFIWYNPKVFGGPWMKELGMTEADAQKGNMAKIFGVSFILAVVLAFSFARYPHDGAMHGAVHAFFPWVYFVLPVMATNMMYEQRSWKFIFINITYWLVAMCVMAIIFYALGNMPEYPQDEAMNLLPGNWVV